MTVWQGQVTFQGSGNVSARTISRQQAQVRIQGVGAVSLFARTPRQQISANFAGAGDFSPMLIKIPSVSLSTITTWPATLPQCPILNGFSEQKQTNNVSFSPDVGPPKVRRRSTGAAWQTSVAYRMTTAQLSDFNDFYETSLSDGSVPFSWNHPVQQITYYWMFDPKDAPKIDRVTPGTFRVTFNLLRLS